MLKDRLTENTGKAVTLYMGSLLVLNAEIVSVSEAMEEVLTIKIHKQLGYFRIADINGFIVQTDRETGESE